MSGRRQALCQCQKQGGCRHRIHCLSCAGVLCQSITDTRGHVRHEEAPQYCAAHLSGDMPIHQVNVKQVAADRSRCMNEYGSDPAPRNGSLAGWHALARLPQNFHEGGGSPGHGEMRCPSHRGWHTARAQGAVERPVSPSCCPHNEKKSQESHAGRARSTSSLTTSTAPAFAKRSSRRINLCERQVQALFNAQQQSGTVGHCFGRSAIVAHQRFTCAWSVCGSAVER